MSERNNNDDQRPDQYINAPSGRSICIAVVVVILAIVSGSVGHSMGWSVFAISMILLLILLKLDAILEELRRK